MFAGCNDFKKCEILQISIQPSYFSHNYGHSRQHSLVQHCYFKGSRFSEEEEMETEKEFDPFP